MLKRKKKTKKVSDYMSTSVYFVSPQSKCNEALAEMSKRKIKHLPVVSMGKIVGIVSDRDLRLVCAQNPEKVSVSELMNVDPYIVYEDASLIDVVKEMKKQHIGCAIVRDILGQPKGLFTSTDALSVLGNLLETA